MGTPDLLEELEAGRNAFERHDWRDAFEALGRADHHGRLTPQDLERLGEAAWWIGQLDDCIDAWQRAFTSYLDAGEPRSAANVAIKLVASHRDRGSKSIAAGWLKRAIRLLEAEDESLEHGYLAHALALRAYLRSRFDEAVTQADRALDIGTRHGDRDLQALALSVRGEALVSRGEAEEGRALLEEATAAAVGGELGPRSTAVVFCRMIATCHDLADYGSAGEWAEAAKRWCERQAIAGFPGICRVNRAEVLRLRGSWPEAQDELTLAAEELTGFNVTAAGSAFSQIGMIRLLAGDQAEAERFFRQARELAGWEPEPGMALLRLRRGDVAAARSGLRRALEEEVDPLLRAQLLPATVEVSLAAGDLEAARSAVDELSSTAGRYATQALEAHEATARGMLALEEGHAVDAIRDLRRALKLWQEIDLPYEAARARTTLAAAYRAEGDEGDARIELEAAKATFDKLGAVPDAARAEALLRAGEGAGSATRALRTFMFTDIVGSTSLIEAMGDDAWENLRRWHDESLRTCFAHHGGEEIDHAGDGFFVAFQDARAAVDCAREIQRKLEEHRRTHGFAPQIRIGVHAAEALRSVETYGGKGVHEAARIGALAGAGEILASAETVSGIDDLPVSEPRPLTLKGIREPVAVVSIGWG